MDSNINPNLLLNAAVEIGKSNPRAAEIAHHLMRQRQLRETDIKAAISGTVARKKKRAAL